MDHAFFVTLSKKDMVCGRVFLFIRISSLSIGIFFGFTVIRKVVFGVFLWILVMFWNKKIFWCSSCFCPILWHCENGYLMVMWKYGNVWMLVLVMTHLDTVGVVLNMLWFAGNGLSETEFVYCVLLAMYLDAGWCFSSKWQEGESYGAQCRRSLTTWRRTGRVITRNSVEVHGYPLLGPVRCLMESNIGPKEGSDLQHGWDLLNDQTVLNSKKFPPLFYFAIIWMQYD